MPGHAIDLTNQFLIAMPGMDDENFAGAVIYLCEHTERGALGLVINRPSDITFKNLFEKVDLSLERDDIAGQPVYIGGPVQTERGFVLHERVVGESADGVAANDTISYTSSMRIAGGALEMTTSKDVLEAMAQGTGPKRVFISLGYSGWSAGQLEDEISRNGWITVDAEPSVIFDTPTERRYDKALSLLGIDRGMLSSEAGHA